MTDRPRPRVGLALGAGAARGMAHIGVLKVLERRAVPLDLVCGSSIGAMVGGIYAATHDLHMIERIALSMRWDLLLDLSFPRLGFIEGRKALEFLNLLTLGKTFDQLLTPFAAVAVDIETGEEVVIDSGSVASAIRASISVPGIVVPARLGGRLLVDGGLLDRTPADVTRRMGADIVIAVDLGKSKLQKVRTIIDVVANALDLMDKEIASSRVVEADVLVCPRTDGIGATRLDKAEELISAGELAAEQCIDRIENLLRERLGAPGDDSVPQMAGS